jgi:hypothetical protein
VAAAKLFLCLYYQLNVIKSRGFKGRCCRKVAYRWYGRHWNRAICQRLAKDGFTVVVRVLP